MTSFQKLVQEYPTSEWAGSSYYWMGEARYHQEKIDEAFSYFHRVVEKYPENEFYAYALYSCGWIRLKQGGFEEGHSFSIRSTKRSLPIPLLSPPSSGPDTASIRLGDILRPFRNWRSCFKSTRREGGDPKLNI
jgi:tetratricopeptide (TPR) repeat protein